MTTTFDYQLDENPNVEVLDEELREALAGLDGIQYDPNTKMLRVISFNDAHTQEDVDAVVHRHDPKKKPKRALETERIRSSVQALRDFMSKPAPNPLETATAVRAVCNVLLYLVKNYQELE